MFSVKKAAAAAVNRAREGVLAARGWKKGGWTGDAGGYSGKKSVCMIASINTALGLPANCQAIMVDQRRFARRKKAFRVRNEAIRALHATGCEQFPDHFKPVHQADEVLAFSEMESQIMRFNDTYFGVNREIVEMMLHKSGLALEGDVA